ncbi:hypothetical protein SAMN04487910_2102 [Aquimarina amphilecti]|uniref:Uncharacterized protein n=1 Tax=Aquimarina amphilecti TaxID=1038014 RepID=A0A1H7NIU0_AQUAM|nr:hypothetical protein SAMN04487910_2102 [Aquimarina amphilecti]
MFLKLTKTLKAKSMEDLDLEPVVMEMTNKTAAPEVVANGMVVIADLIIRILHLVSNRILTLNNQNYVKKHFST